MSLDASVGAEAVRQELETQERLLAQHGESGPAQMSRAALDGTDQKLRACLDLDTNEATLLLELVRRMRTTMVDLSCLEGLVGLASVNHPFRRPVPNRSPPRMVPIRCMLWP